MSATGNSAIELTNFLKEVIVKEISDKEKAEKELAEMKIKYEKLEKEYKIIEKKNSYIKSDVRRCEDSINDIMFAISEHKTKIPSYLDGRLQMFKNLIETLG